MFIKMTHLKFIIDKEYDARMAYQMLRSGDPAGLESRAASMGLEIDWAKKINLLSWSKAKRTIELIVKEKYRTIGKKLDQTKTWYQKSWNEIDKKFFAFIAKKTEYKWQYKLYYCVVSAFHPGISNWGGNKIVRIWSENPFTMRRITAHELIIAHIFFIFHNDPKYQGVLEDNQIWKIAEIRAWCLTGLELAIIKFWPWVPKHRLFYTNHNYPMLVDMQIRLGEIYPKLKFNDFLDKAVEMVKEQ